MNAVAPDTGFAARLADVITRVEDLSCAELDRLAGLGSSVTYRIINGSRTRVGAAVAAKLALATGASLDWLLLGRGEEPTLDGVTAAVARARADHALSTVPRGRRNSGERVRRICERAKSSSA